MPVPVDAPRWITPDLWQQLRALDARQALDHPGAARTALDVHYDDQGAPKKVWVNVSQEFLVK